tara:strand:- start:1357 stop:2403 length:1047 start_codon:yes stop_codon:yes gene_type:complete
MQIIKDFKNIAINRGVSLRDAMSHLDKNGIQVLLLIDDGNKLVGVITDGDIRRHLLSDSSLETKAQEIANKEYFSIKEDQIDNLEILFAQKSIRHIPIINKSGILTSLALKAELEHKGFHASVPIVIMAGGKGTRLAPLTKIIPKALVPVGEQTMIEKIMEQFYKQSFEDFKVVANYKKRLVKSYLDEIQVPYSIEIFEEEKYLGTAGGLKLFKDNLPEYFVMSNCDVIAELNYHDFIQSHIDSKSDLSILGVKVNTKMKYGVLNLDSNERLKSVEEKPEFSHIINAGIYVFTRDVLDQINKEACDMDELITILLEKEKRISTYVIDDGWFDIGEFDEYKKLLQYVGE